MRRKSRRYLWFDYNKSLLQQFVGVKRRRNGQTEKWRTAIIFFSSPLLSYTPSDARWNFHCRLTWLSVDSQINSSKLFSGTIMAHHFHEKKKKRKSCFVLSRSVVVLSMNAERGRVRDRKSWREMKEKLFSTYIFQFTAAAVSCWFRMNGGVGESRLEWICTCRRRWTVKKVAKKKSGIKNAH